MLNPVLLKKAHERMPVWLLMLEMVLLLLMVMLGLLLHLQMIEIVLEMLHLRHSQIVWTGRLSPLRQGNLLRVGRRVQLPDRARRCLG